MKQRTIFIVGAVMATLAIVIIYAIFFRAFARESLNFGRITYKMRWGRPREALVDFNRDGVIDLRGIYPASSGEIFLGDPFHEYWQASRCDGHFDIHVVYSRERQVEFGEYDADGDGRYDTFATGSKVFELVATATGGRKELCPVAASDSQQPAGKVSE